MNLNIYDYIEQSQKEDTLFIPLCFHNKNCSHKISYLSVAEKNVDVIPKPPAITKTVIVEKCQFFSKCNKYHCELIHHKNRKKPEKCWHMETNGKCYKCDNETK